jgi:hypothetical protein
VILSAIATLRALVIPPLDAPSQVILEVVIAVVTFAQAVSNVMTRSLLVLTNAIVMSLGT